MSSVKDIKCQRVMGMMGFCQILHLRLVIITISICVINQPICDKLRSVKSRTVRKNTQVQNKFNVVIS